MSSNTASAAAPTVKPAKVTIARADNAGDRQIFRNGVLVGSCYQARMSWGGEMSRKPTYWIVTNVFGHCHRGETDTLAQVRAQFA